MGATEQASDEITRAIKDRLEFVELIDKLNAHFLDPKLIRETPEGGWTHPWKYFDALRNYLLLTCFDLLGQASNFKDFQSWLSAEACAGERAEIEKTISASSAFESAAAIHRGYLKIYGVRNAFFRFINEILTPNARKELLYSVRIQKIDPIKNVEIDVIESDEKKMNWLYNIRNKFTHRAENTGSPAGGVFGSLGRKLVIDGKVKMGWEPIDLEQEGGFRIEYGVRDWPQALKDAVMSGLRSHRAKQ